VTHFFSESEIDLNLLIEIFNTEQFQSRLNGDRLHVFDGAEVPFFISIDTKAGVMKVQSDARVVEDVDPNELDQFIQHLNEHLATCVFHKVRDEDDRQFLRATAFQVIHFGIDLLALYFFCSSFSASCASGRRLAEEYGFLKRQSDLH
jgi:hypothetical protein